MKLYDYELSGNCYKIRLFLNILGLKHDVQTVDFHPGREHKTAAFLAVNPLGQLPVLKDGGRVICDSKDILIHLASGYDESGLWYPAPAHMQVAHWLAVADEITASASAARLCDTFFHDLDGIAARAAAHRLFRQIDEHLWFGERQGQDWLIPEAAPTLADIACFPYIALSEEGGVSRLDYPAIRRWCDRIKRIKGFIPMPGIFPNSRAV